MDRNTIIEDEPQESIRRASLAIKVHRRLSAASPMSDRFPTPRGGNVIVPFREASTPSPTSSDASSERNSIWSRRTSQSERSEFDEMYDISETESEGDVPIKLSRSVKKRMNHAKTRRPALDIPSPSEWPRLDKLKSGTTPLSPPPKIKLATSVLEQLNASVTPSSSTTPSLDGSSTDEELAGSSCPPTPDLAAKEDSPWELPIQLDPSSISLLQQITSEPQEEPQETVIEVRGEMTETVVSPRTPGLITLQTQNLAPAEPIDAEDELAMLSIPTPGGFFSSLNSAAARRNWSGTQQTPSTSVATNFYDCPFPPSRQSTIPTSIATSFYDLPWSERPGNPIEHTVSLDVAPAVADGPITAIKLVASPDAVEPTVDEIDETYDDALKESAAANIDRTMLWLGAQTDYMKTICEEDDVIDSFKDVADAVPKTPDQASPAANDVSPVSDVSPKKSVRFADEEPVVPETKTQPENKRISPIHDGTFWEGWRHAKRSQRARDVFQHRQARAEAEHVKRTSCQNQHVEQLQGKYEITSPDRPAPSRPISDLISSSEESKNETIERAEHERRALEQMQSSSWHVSAQREVSGGKLLTSPIVQSFKHRNDVRILDLGGQVHCSWAWDVALEHPRAMVYTTVSSDAEAHVAESTLEGPANHFVVAAPQPWQLPFNDNYFDIISARSLYANLKKLWPKGQAADEWDLTLRECLRCLKPGGYLEFNLLDAELMQPEAAGQALGVEFAFNLKTRGYDPCSGKTFLPRLKRAGFQDIKRAWMLFPVADVIPRWSDAGRMSLQNNTREKSIGPLGEVEICTPRVTGSTKDVRAMTGLVGARMWEQWMLKLNCEMGRSESRCLEGVSHALEECGKGSTSWRCLVGWAKKGY